MSELAEVKGDDLRASDREREQVASTLREHAGEGRLDMGELSDRLDGAYSARTRAELLALTGDLPGPPPPPRADVRRVKARRELRGHAISFAVVNLLLIGVWAATGADYFWPIWPLLGWGVGVASHAMEALGGRPLLRGGHCSRRSRRPRHARREVEG